MGDVISLPDVQFDITDRFCFHYSVTSVGATNNIDEVGTFFSGGGFSDYFPRPSYQDKAVETYLKKLPKGLYEGLYNPYVVLPLSNSYVLHFDTSPRLQERSCKSISF
jgi:hypothetical protein